MRPLLWKEMRDLRPWLLSGLGATAAAALLVQSESMANRFMGGYLDVFMPLFATLIAIGLGLGQVAKERHARTLDFLLVRPVPASRVVWIKFVSGAIVLALLLTAIVALGYSHRGGSIGALAEVIRGQVGSARLTATLFPRYLFLYAIALFLSVLVDRTAKAGAAAGALVIALVALGSAFLDRSPFSRLPIWFPFFDESGGLVRSAQTPSLFWLTGGAFTLAALLLTFGSAAMLRRFPGRYLGTRALVAGAVIVTGAAILAARVAPEYLPVVAPAAILDLPADPENTVEDMAAAGERVAVAMSHRLLVLDFAAPARLRKAAEIAIPLWTTSQVAMAGDTAFLVGRKKAVPVDESAIAIVALTPDSAALTGAISLGPPSPGDLFAKPVLIDGFLYAAMTRQGLCSLHVYDLSSKPAGREVAAIVIDKLRAPRDDGNIRTATIHTSRRGSQLYLTTPSRLTAIDVTNPGQPLLSGAVAFSPASPSLYAFPRILASLGDRLYEASYWPPVLGSYDLHDPDRPARNRTLPWSLSGGFVVLAGSHSLYQAWGRGLVEFRPGTTGIQALRYLNDGDPHSVRDIASAGDFVYALKRLRDANRVEAFWIGPPVE